MKASAWLVLATLLQAGAFLGALFNERASTALFLAIIGFIITAGAAKESK